MKLDIGQFPAIARHLGPLLEQIEARSLSPERLMERYGWIAHELINGAFWDDAQYSLLNDALGLLADGMDAKRLCNADFVDAFWAELLVVAGLRARFGEDFGYESFETTKGRNPDACLPNAKVIFEVAFVDEWQVSLDRTKLQNLLGQKLRQARFKGELRVKLDHPLTIPAPHDWADKIAAWALEQPFDGSMKTGRLLYTDSGRPDGKVHFEMRFRPGPGCMVKCEAPNIFPLQRWSPRLIPLACRATLGRPRLTSA
jgi:hypothetical protein